MPEAKDLTGKVNRSHILRMSNDGPGVAAGAVVADPHAADVIGQAAGDRNGVEVKPVGVLADDGIDSVFNSVADDSFNRGLFHIVPLSGFRLALSYGFIIHAMRVNVKRENEKNKKIMVHKWCKNAPQMSPSGAGGAVN